MKILTIAATPYFSNRGCHIRIFLEAKHLQQQGNDVLLCTYHLGRDAGNFKIKRIGEEPWYKKLNPGFSWGKIWLDIKLLFLCVHEAKRFKPDIIHAHLFEGLAIGFLAKKIAFLGCVPIVADLQGDLDSEFESYNKKQSIARSFFVWISKIVVGWADWIVLSSENAKDSLLQIYKQEDKVSIIKDGVDLDFFANPQTAGEELQQELEKIKHWKSSSKVLIYTGGMEDSKGAFDLLREFVGEIEKNENLRKTWKLLMFGDGNDKEKYEKMVKERGAQDHVLFAKETGFFALPNFLKLADAGIDPKTKSTESSGKLVNYMAAGLPVICFENTFNRAMLKDQGWYLEKIADLKDLLLQQNFAGKSYDLVGTKESAEIEKMSQLFEKLIKKKKIENAGKSCFFPESKLAHQYLDGLEGIEIGGSAHNSFGLNTKNVDIADSDEDIFKREEMEVVGERLPIDILASGDKLPFEDESLDFVVSSHVIEHFADPISALKEWYRVIKTGGYIFMIVPHKERTYDRKAPRTILEELIKRHEEGFVPEVAGWHYSFWITEDMIELIEYLGWNIVDFQDVDDKAGNGFAIVIRKEKVNEETKKRIHEQLRKDQASKNGLLGRILAWRFFVLAKNIKKEFARNKTKGIIHRAKTLNKWQKNNRFK